MAHGFRHCKLLIERASNISYQKSLYTFYYTNWSGPHLTFQTDPTKVFVFTLII